ncbi:MAG: nuclease [Peltula sp. TS41687]|nr:MAG: nuclease [Peltula sp. TS41687]
MSRTTFALIAAAGVVTGAATSAIYFTSKSRQRPYPTTTTTTTASEKILPTRTATAPPPGRPIQPSADRCPPVDPTGVFQYGFPGPVNDLATRLALVSSYDRRLRNPNWVAEHITPESLRLNGGDRHHSFFEEDQAVPEMFRAKLRDYQRSGYDRGHQVPAADAKWDQEAMNGTFYLTNMCPQVGEGFNRDYWAHLEDFCRRLTRSYPSVRIITGPLYLPKRDPHGGKWTVSYEVIGNPPSVAVPTHFYKVIFAEDGQTGGKVALGAFVLPNAPISNDKPLTDFEAPVELVERASGLEFATKLPRERRKRLCSEVPCSLVVRTFDDSRKNLGGRSNRPPLPGPSR